MIRNERCENILTLVRLRDVYFTERGKEGRKEGRIERRMEGGKVGRIEGIGWE